jgi:hypothetical protein
MCLSINTDTAECPDHGRITGLEAREWANLPRLEAEIEIKAAQLHDLMRGAFSEARRRLRNGTLSVPIRQWHWEAWR